MNYPFHFNCRYCKYQEQHFQHHCSENLGLLTMSKTSLAKTRPFWGQQKEVLGKTIRKIFFKISFFNCFSHSSLLQKTRRNWDIQSNLYCHLPNPSAYAAQLGILLRENTAFKDLWNIVLWEGISQRVIGPGYFFLLTFQIFSFEKEHSLANHPPPQSLRPTPWMAWTESRVT